MQHPAVLIRSFALRQKGLANKLPAALAVGSQAAALCLTSSYGADLTGRLARWRWIKGETEEMPLLSRRRQPLPAPSFAIRTPWDTKSFYIKFLPVIGAGAAYLPANHPLTRVAERLRDIHLLAMEALVVERHGANSAVAAAFRANSRSSPIPIRVYKCGSPRMDGFTDGNCIAIRDTAVKPHSKTIPHELAHFVLRHVAELQLMQQQEAAAAKQQNSLVFGVMWTALLGTASCVPALSRLPLGGTPGCLVLGALRMYHAAFDPAAGSGVAPHLARASCCGGLC
ncbi:hypothetical protein D9Q98_002503 [Chlorella vulgaris]|uniref:Uncharacterized protein n=1 Tax=Chlorella vulgaris TaxID=3077 RepID=A0A9D4TTH2_CHLVU|nr:hypothetical protein D9Q98_002503 [Chlorella vulgaris]